MKKLIQQILLKFNNEAIAAFIIVAILLLVSFFIFGKVYGLSLLACIIICPIIVLFVIKPIIRSIDALRTKIGMPEDSNGV